MSKEIKKTLNNLSEKETNELLDAANLILSTLKSSQNKDSGIVYSIRLLDKDEMERINVFVKDKFGQEYILENKIDETLLAGIKIVCGDKVIDGSLKKQAEDLKNSMHV